MKKINVLFFSLAILFLMSCGGGEAATTDETTAEDTTTDVPELSEDEQTVANLCECGAEVPAIMNQFREKKIDQAAYMEKMEAFEKCMDPDGKLKAKEEAMSKEEMKVYGAKMNALTIAKCPELAKEMGMVAE